jgi:transposase-like protein
VSEEEWGYILDLSPNKERSIPMPQIAAIKSVRRAFRMIKSLEMRGVEFQEDHRQAGREALAQIIQDRMHNRIDKHLEEIASKDEEDRRNGFYSRHLLTELGDIELQVPRTRHFSAIKVIKAYARRCANIDRTILACFVLGLSTRKVSKALLGILGETISPTTVSRVARILDGAVRAFHKRKLADIYEVLLLDGVVLARKTGAGAVRRPVLVALGIRKDGKKEVIDFRLAKSESTAEWETFLTDMYHRGLTGEKWKMICVDGGQGLLAALRIVHPNVPIQRCWAHKMRNLLDKAKKKDHKKMKKSLQKIYRAKNIRTARNQAQRFAKRWSESYPNVVNSLRDDLEDLLTFFSFKKESWRKATRTTNAIERRFVEVRRRTRPMGVFADRTSMERILFAVFAQENKNQGTMAPFLLTQNS